MADTAPNRLDFAMATTAQLLARTSNSTNSSTSALSPGADGRPSSYKAIGISLAIASGLFIGVSFVLKKYGLLKANDKYQEVAGDGYGYLKNTFWWAGMILMILGELCNFVAYAFTDAILVTPLGALSVVLTTVLSAFFLKERLSLIGKVACFLCVIGSIVIVMNAPASSSVANIQDMRNYVIAPGFLSYTGVVIIGALIGAFYAGPRWGKRNMLVYISICSWVGGLSVVATQGLGSAIVAQAGGTPQFNQWFLYVLLVFVICTLLTEIIFLNKALNLFNAAMVTPTYYVYFTSTTILTSSILFRGFRGTPTAIVTMVLGFLTICAGVVLLQLSKSAKDVPDVAVFSGHLDQIQTIAEQEESETEPRADAIRGAAAIVRRFSTVRQKRELGEAKRLREDKMAEHLQAIGEESPSFEWDGLRRRKTILSTGRAPSRAAFVPPVPTSHPPLGMTHFPTEEELRLNSGPSFLSSIAGTIRGRARTLGSPDSQPEKVYSPPLAAFNHADLSFGNQEPAAGGATSWSEDAGMTGRGIGIGGGNTSSGLEPSLPPSRPNQSQDLAMHNDLDSDSSPLSPPGGLGVSFKPPGSARHFSFHNVFKRPTVAATKSADSYSRGSGSRVTYYDGSKTNSSSGPTAYTEEERLGLVKGDSRSAPTLPRHDDIGDGYSLGFMADEDISGGPASRMAQPSIVQGGRSLTPLPASPPSPNSSREDSMEPEDKELVEYETMRHRWTMSQPSSQTPDRPSNRPGQS